MGYISFGDYSLDLFQVNLYNRINHSLQGKEEKLAEGHSLSLHKSLSEKENPMDRTHVYPPVLYRFFRVQRIQTAGAGGGGGNSSSRAGEGDSTGKD